MSNIIDFGVLGVGKLVQFGKGGNRLLSNSGVFSALAVDGVTLARLQVADPVNPSDAVTLRVLQAQPGGSASTGQNVRTVTASATMLASDGTLSVKPSAPVTITLETSPANGATHIVKDGNGTSATNVITIVAAANGTIDGAPNFLLNFNRGSVTLVYTGSEWSVV